MDTWECPKNCNQIMPWGEVGCPNESLSVGDPCPIWLSKNNNRGEMKMSNQTTANQPNTKVVTGKVRLSYAHIWEPKEDQQGNLKYSVSLIIPKSDTATIKKIKAACEVVKQTQAAKWGGKVPATLKMPLRDGDIDRPDDEAYKNSYFVNANSTQKPGIVDRQVNPVMDQSEVYSGCFARVSINFFAYNNSGNKGIGCGLNHIQKVADGEPLSGRGSAETDFDALCDDDDDFLD